MPTNVWSYHFGSNTWNTIGMALRATTTMNTTTPSSTRAHGLFSNALVPRAEYTAPAVNAGAATSAMHTHISVVMNFTRTFVVLISSGRPTSGVSRSWASVQMPWTEQHCVELQPHEVDEHGMERPEHWQYSCCDQQRSCGTSYDGIRPKNPFDMHVELGKV